MQWASVTRAELRNVNADQTVVVIPVGATEQHGDHLPVDTDTHSVTAVADAVAAQLDWVVVAPAISYGFSVAHVGLPGTLSLRPETLMAVLRDLAGSVQRNGFKRLLFLNGHTSNLPLLDVVVRELALDGMLAAAASYFDFAREAFQAVRRSPVGGAGHACEFETSLQLHLRPDLVRMDRAQANVRANGSRYRIQDMFYPPPIVVQGARYATQRPQGVAGDPTLATAEMGQLVFDAAVTEIVAFMEEFRQQVLPQ